jgi:hypothetical protein
MSGSYATVTCLDCKQARSVLRNNKPLPQRCSKCARLNRSKAPQKDRVAPASRTSDKARLRDRFLEAFRDTDTPCKEAPDMWMSASLADRNRAKALCREQCPLVALCDAWASEPPRETYGVWGARDHSPKEKKEKQR